MAEVEQLLLQHTRDHAAAGNIRQVATRTRDVIDAVAQVALFNERTLRQGLNAEDLGLQLEFGLPEELVALAQVVGTELNRGEYLALLGANIRLLAGSSGFGPAWRVDGGKIVSLTA